MNGKIKLDVMGNATISAEAWEDGWDAISTLASADVCDADGGVVTADSEVRGTVRVPVCSKSERRRVEERFEGLKVSVDEETYTQFNDKYFLSVLNAKMNSGNLVTRTQCENLTSNSNWFQNDKQIEHIDFSDFPKNTSGSKFSGCSELKTIKFGAARGDLNNNGWLNGCSSLIFLYAPKTTYNGNYGQCGDTHSGKVFFYPDARMAQMRAAGSLIQDFGKKGCTITNMETTWVTSANAKYILRCADAPTYNYCSGTNYASWGSSNFHVWVYQEYLSKFQASQYKCTWHVIGDTEWQTAMRTLASQYAAEYAGWSAEQIATADYSDPYIDYRIFGLEPPTE